MTDFKVPTFVRSYEDGPKLAVASANGELARTARGRVITVEPPEEVRALFTESNRPVFSYQNEASELKFATATKRFYKDSFLYWPAQQTMTDKRTLQQKLGDLSTEFFLSHFSDASYADFFKSFYLPVHLRLSDWAATRNLRVPEDICIFYKGGNLFRILLSSIVKIMNIEKLNDLVQKRSDADFQIFVNPKVPNYKEVLNNVSAIVIDCLNNFKVDIGNRRWLELDMQPLLGQYQQLLNQHFANTNANAVAGVNVSWSKNRDGNNMHPYRSDFLMDTFEIQNGERLVGYMEVDSLIEGKKPFATDRSLYVSRNITSDFTTFSGNRYIFELIRLKRNVSIAIDVETKASIKTRLSLKVPSEVIDVSIPRQGDHSVEHMVKRGVRDFITEYWYEDEMSAEGFAFYGVNIKYLIHDLNDILFAKFEWPWVDPKYKKRIGRYFICILLSVILKATNVADALRRLRSDVRIVLKYLGCTHCVRAVNIRLIEQPLLRGLVQGHEAILGRISTATAETAIQLQKNNDAYVQTLVELCRDLLAMSRALNLERPEVAKQIEELRQRGRKGRVSLVGGCLCNRSISRKSKQNE